MTDTAPDPLALPEGQELRFMRLDSVLSKIDRTKTQFYREIREGKWPRPTRDGKLSYWLHHEIEAAMRARVMELRGLAA